MCMSKCIPTVYSALFFHNTVSDASLLFTTSKNIETSDEGFEAQADVSPLLAAQTQCHFSTALFELPLNGRF